MRDLAASNSLLISGLKRFVYSDGKVTIIKSFLIPKFVYVCSLLPTPKEVIKTLNQLLFKFLWTGTDKVTRVLVKNKYEKGGLKMIDLDW